MPSPPRPQRRSPPRRALHERSDSHTNEISLPTLRIIGDSAAPIYRSSPFPTQASQVLPPKGRGPGWVFEDEVGVSDDDNPTKHLAQTPVHITNQKSREDAPDSTENVVPSSSIAPHDTMVWSRYNSARPVPDAIIELPSVPRFGSSNVRADTPDSSSSVLGFQDATSRGFLPSKVSENSLSSTESSGTVIRKRTDRSTRPLYSAFPQTSNSRPGSSRSNRASLTLLKPIVKSSIESLSPASSASFTKGRHISSTASHASLQEAINSETHVQYPVIRPPAFSGSWAESSENVPQRSSRMNDRNTVQRWNPHLSTVQSEHSENRSSSSLHLHSSVVLGNSSSILADEGLGSTNLPLPPGPAWAPQRDGSGSTIRVVTNQDGNLPRLPPPILRSPGSAFFSIRSRDSDGEKRRDASPTRPATRGSFLGIPAWARAYYARPPRDPLSIPPGSSSADTSSRPQSKVSRSDGNFPLGVFRPRTRQREGDAAPPTRDSMAITPAEVADDRPVEIRGPARHKVTEEWSPHLWHDRRTTARRIIFRAPSLDEEAEESGLSRRTLQMLLFAVGFVFPIAWIVASFVPLPPKPTPHEEQSQTRAPSTTAQDLEKAVASIKEARYENARWWRNVNRIMSLPGLLIIGAIIALAVIAVRLKS